MFLVSYSANYFIYFASYSASIIYKLYSHIYLNIIVIIVL